MLTFDFSKPADLERFARVVSALQEAGARFRVTDSRHTYEVRIHIGEEEGE